MFERGVPVFPERSVALEAFGLKFSSGGAHISRTMMLEELESVLSAVPVGSAPGDYRDAILLRNALGKTTDSTRQKSLRHTSELRKIDQALNIGATATLLQVPFDLDYWREVAQ